MVKRGNYRTFISCISVRWTNIDGFQLMDLRQYSVFDQAHGVCGWYNR
jgi:hypothetical protein